VGTRVRFNGTDMVRLGRESCKVEECWIVSEFLSLMKQLGAAAAGGQRRDGAGIDVVRGGGAGDA
jgi:hypothetical protein